MRPCASKERAEASIEQVYRYEPHNFSVCRKKTYCRNGSTEPQGIISLGAKVNQLERLFEFINQNGFNSKNLEVRSSLWSGPELHKLIEELKVITNTRYTEQEASFKGTFNFEANADLSGGSDWCSSPMCRLRKADELARFSALYSDKVFIANPFDKYEDFDASYFEEPRIWFIRRCLAGDIAVLLYLKPLFEAGLLEVRASPSHVCYDCINKVVDPDSDIKKVLDALRNELRSIYYQGPEYIFRTEKEFYTCTAIGGEHLIEHGETTLQYSKVHHPDLRVLAKSLGKRKSKRLSSEELRAVGMVETLMDPVLDGLLVQNFSAKIHGTTYLTNKSVEVNLINKTGNRQIANVSTAMLEGFSHSIPSINSVPIQSILALREQQHDAFLVYRDALDGALKESRNLNSADIKVLVNDTVRPEINKIERAINVSKKLLSHGLKTDVLIGAGFITVGLFAGLLPTDTKPLIEALSAGAGGAAALDVARRLTNSDNAEAKVAENPYYFLWKAKRTL